MAVYSHNEYERITAWKNERGSTPTLFDSAPRSTVQFSSRDDARCRVIESFDALCKSGGLGVGMASSRGLRTRDPNKPINFWRYVPQSDLDKAPTRAG